VNSLPWSRYKTVHITVLHIEL